MNIVSALALPLVIALGLWVFFKARSNDKLAALPLVKLQEESFFDGRPNNKYSREIDRREKEALQTMGEEA